MSRESLGSWGVGLSRDDFAAALAAAGAGGDHADLMSRQLRQPNLIWSLETAPTAPAERLAEAWWQARETAPDIRPRLRVRTTNAVSPAWVLETLGQAQIGLGSAFVPFRKRGLRVPWSWPLQVAVLGPGRAELRERLREGEWVERFVELVEIEEPRPCDLVLVTRGIRQALPLVLEAPVKASAVAFLAAMPDGWDSTHALVETVLAETGAGAILFVTAPDPAAWLNSTLFELSHDQPLDVAVFRAAEASGEAPPVLLADPALLEETRMSRVAQRLQERLAMAPVEAAAEPVAANGGEAPPAPTVEELQERISHVTEYLHETGGASDLAELEAAVREAVPAPAPRFVQGQVFEQGGDGLQRVHAFRTSALHELHVRVGPADREWVADETAPVPEEELPPGQEHLLRVVLTEPHLLDEPQVAELVLPAYGPSKPATFWLRTPAAEMPVQARILVLHEGRVLQTAILSGVVRAEPEAVAEDEQVKISVESFVHPFMALAGRTPFDAAFVVNHDREGISQLTTITGSRADIREPETLKVAFREITTKLQELVTADETLTGLRDERMRELLVFLAVQGRSIYDRLADVRPDSTIAEMNRIQILSLEPEQLFPLEFVYDRTSPNEDAQICDTAEEELANGSLATCPAHTDPRYVCPLGFWGLRKVIERHANDPTAEPIPEDFRVTDWPDDGRKKRLRPFTGAVFAASSKADLGRPETTTELVQRLAGVIGTEPARAVTWDEWQGGVQSTAAPLLVLLPHSLPHPTLNVPTLEIGDEQLVRFDMISEAYVGANWPLVFLLGCKTTEAPVEFQKFPTRFRKLKAGVVVATVTKVLGRNAGPVAGELVAEFAEQSKSAQITFGEVLRRVRCALVARGISTVLTVVAYGDADWVFEPREE